jgi:hypothetical protein
MSDKPNCLCGHSYGSHAWGTSFCVQVTGNDGKVCGCQKYREGLCPCGHAWEVHAIVGGTVVTPESLLPCPVCGQSCKSWKTGETPKMVDRKLAECTCGHDIAWHNDYCKACRGKECNCQKFELKMSEIKKIAAPTAVCECSHYKANHLGGHGECRVGASCPCKEFKEPTSNLNVFRICECGHSQVTHKYFKNECDKCDCRLLKEKSPETELSCTKCVFEVLAVNSIKHGKDCPVWPNGVESTPKTGPTLKKWQEELENEERFKPDCVCGHSCDSHWDDEEGDSCAECLERVEEHEIVRWVSTCKKYTPKDYSEDARVVNQEALKQIGNTGTMTPEEVQKRINEWKKKNGVSDVPGLSVYSNTSGTVPKTPIGGSYGGSGTLYSNCWHKPQKVIDGKHWEVWAGTKNDCTAHVFKFDVILNVSNGLATVPQHEIPFKWAQKYTNQQTKEIMLDWPDQGVPVIDPHFWTDLKNHLSSTKSKMLTFCMGGHGRTGTAVACLLVACGWKPVDAKNWIWRHYCKEAIETAQQESYIDEVYKALWPRKKKAKVKEAAK